MTKQLKLGAMVLLALAATTAMAEDKFVEIPGYAQSAQSGQIVVNDFGECWQDNSGDGSAKYVYDSNSGTCVASGSAPVAPAPNAEPTISRQSTSFSTDVLFAFDRYNLSQEGRAKLDEFAAQLVNVNATDVNVAGHTDFKGSDAYNQRLSERRASTVRNYLVSKGVNPSLITARGYGETQQKMQATCEQQTAGVANKAKRRLALIDCIAPDRRVDVNVNSVKQ